ncbi:L-ascorbate metabolism protein UlaG, beta-lactamase superfamily [Sphingomonas gellani]|uniref:L-ascorbate metabolism protein UlaG, beta-lactamase superfamily n=1 Tax=Sphingomonas gellani TaxID=1166340 RepID=A0A1H8DSZ3_9SPHN|nr:MBL fold metallo-hydrolase [Sphingomonas gellani]SEN10286.1 L-ascorbate metabolism protein UlaG, beta-lactamase superfamily [Sphingomonas gellani]
MPRNPYYAGPPSDHFDGTRFFNTGADSTDAGLLQVLRWKMAGGAARWPRSVPVTQAKPEARVAGMRVTAIGHASMLIQIAGMNILTDPVWSDRASPLSFAGPRRVTAPGVAFADLPPIDVVLLSHNHYDHLDVATLRRLRADHDPIMAMPLGNDAIVARAVPGARIVAGDWNDRLALVGDCTTTLTRANHWSARGTRDRRMALWCGHYLHTPAGSLWFAGDSGYGDGRIFTDIGQRLGPPDMALIPIGAYEPRWFMRSQHANPADAVAILTDVGARRALGIHWGTFQLTAEAREAPVEDLAAALAAAGIAPERFQAAVPGVSYDG